MNLWGQVQEVSRACRRRTRTLFFGGTFRDVTLSKAAIKKMLGNQFSDLTIIEIGAADGRDTEEFLNVFNESDFRMLAIEPEARNLEKFRLRISDPRVNLIEAAISDRDGNAQLYVSNTEYSSSLKVPNLSALQSRWPGMEFENSHFVKTRSLDSLIDQFDVKRIDFVWADIQGAEDLMLHGALRALPITRFLYTEYSHFAESLYEDELSLGEIADLLGDDWVLIRDYGTDALFANLAWC